MNRSLVVAVLDALADVETCYRNADAGGVTHAVGRLLGRLDTVAQDGGRLVLTADQLRSALRHEGAPARVSDIAEWLKAYGAALDPWQQHVVAALDVSTEQRAGLRAADETVAITGLVPAGVLLDELVEVAGVVDRATVDDQTGALSLDPADTLTYRVVDETRIYMNSGAAIGIPQPQFIVTERIDRPGLYVVGSAPLVELPESSGAAAVADYHAEHDCDDGCSP